MPLESSLDLFVFLVVLLIKLSEEDGTFEITVARAFQQYCKGVIGPQLYETVPLELIGNPYCILLKVKLDCRRSNETVCRFRRNNDVRLGVMEAVEGIHTK
ncbi:hypothetical protein L6452_14227 [Arctium lappa]|uniref:Uncharacterized protein n=1 Tax=Arctium lappa TaxID=4217 RepID=A0ACB9CKG2_ARCLA|nr:hypothetical protein L6452_14227 [Arctium lappa]